MTVRRVTVSRMTEVKKSVLGSVRLDSDVWEAVRAMDCSLNQYLRTALLDHPLTAKSMTTLAATPRREPTYSDPRDIPGVSVGPPKRENAGGFPCRCIHSGCRGSKFTGTTRFQNICPECSESGHKGEPRNCQSCADDSATGAL